MGRGTRSSSARRALRASPEIYQLFEELLRVQSDTTRAAEFEQPDPRLFRPKVRACHSLPPMQVSGTHMLALLS